MTARLPRYFQIFQKYLTRVKYLRLPSSAALPDLQLESEDCNLNFDLPHLLTKGPNFEVVLFLKLF
jgi:hypothetical protein